MILWRILLQVGWPSEQAKLSLLGQRKAWNHNSPNPPPKEMSSHGVYGPIFINSTLNAAKYRKFLDEEFIPFFKVMTWSWLLVYAGWFKTTSYGVGFQNAQWSFSWSNHWVELPIALLRWYLMAALFFEFKLLWFLLVELLEEQSVEDKS